MRAGTNCGMGRGNASQDDQRSQMILVGALDLDAKSCPSHIPSTCGTIAMSGTEMTVIAAVESRVARAAMEAAPDESPLAATREIRGTRTPASANEKTVSLAAAFCGTL